MLKCLSNETTRLVFGSYHIWFPSIIVYIRVALEETTIILPTNTVLEGIAVSLILCNVIYILLPSIYVLKPIESFH